MTVRDCMREIQKVEDAINTINSRYDNCEIPNNIEKQHNDEIIELLEHYMDMLAKMKIAT